MKNKFSMALSLAMIVAMLITSMALADNVQNDVVAGGNDTIIAGSSTVINYRIAANNGDGQTGCNAADTSAATVTINVPAGVTAAPGLLTFTSCGSTQAVTFSSNTPGNYAITATVGDSGAGTYNTNPATFTLNVNAAPPPSDTTPPVITPSVLGTLGENGWYVSDVIVSWTVEDGESAISSSSGCDSTTIDSDTAGTTLTCSATSAGGTSSQSVTIQRDATAPTISGSASPAANGAGWNNTDVDVTFLCGDNLSGVASCGPDQTLSSDGAGQSVIGTAVDNAGNSASDTVSDINIDQAAPSISASIAPTASGTGWYNISTGAPTVSFTCNETGGSGLVGSCPAAVTLGEGADQSVSGGPVSDLAGNVSNVATISNIDVDLTAPSVSLVGGPANGSSHYFGSVPAAPTCSASDALSGLAGACSVTGYSDAVGTHTVTASASDNAGNSASASSTYTVLAWTLNGFYAPVDMNGTLNVVKGGSTVPLKFEVFAGATELTATSVVNSFVQTRIACDGGATLDEIEVTSTGGTSLRYDTTGGQFIQNWQTPRTAGTCYRVTMTTDDGSSLVALFKLK